MQKALWLLLLLACSGGCGEDGENARPGASGALPVDTTARPKDWPAAAARQLKPDHHPTPYTAEQIRSGCADGRSSTFRMDFQGTEMLQRWRFDAGDAKGVTWTLQRLEPDGTADGEPSAQRHEWAKLQAHASYPADQTKVSEETIKTPAGTYACMRYTVTRTKEVVRKVDGEDVRSPIESVTDSWFAYALPGPPVKQEEHVGGRLVSVMELVEHEMPTAK